MKTSDKGRKFIEDFEGLILGAYDDHNDRIVEPGQTVIGTLTIGYGHTGPDVFIGQKITKEEADALLAKDLAETEVEVTHVVTVPINQNEFDALVSFQFNTGALEHSTLLKHLNNTDYQGAADQFLVWDHVHGQVVSGLTRRRKAERAMFLGTDTPQVIHGTAAAATTAIVVGTVVGTATSQPIYHSPLIFLGIIAASVLVGLAVHYFVNRKVT